MAADVKDVHRTVSMSQVWQQWSRYNKYFSYIRDIRKVRKRQGEYREFGHIHGLRFKKNLQKSTLALRGAETQKTINFYGFLSFTLSFFFPERLHCCYIDFHCSYLSTYIKESVCVRPSVRYPIGWNSVPWVSLSVRKNHSVWWVSLSVRKNHSVWWVSFSVRKNHSVWWVSLCVWFVCEENRVPQCNG